jgi:hypothetical protein
MIVATTMIIPSETVDDRNLNSDEDKQPAKAEVRFDFLAFHTLHKRNDPDL